MRLFFIAPLVPVVLLAPGLVLVEPPVLPSLYSEASPGTLLGGKTAGCDGPFRSRLAAKSPNTGRRATGADPEKKKGRIEMRPKFREEKPEGLAMRTGGPASHRMKRIGLSFSTNG
ncbi:MAG TPA: hypothetical protein VGU20_03295 [Stellaceae bacterium]|nr:hypothetical protein [Stellaceae bacterium]